VLVVGSAVGIYYYLRVIFAMSKSTDGDGESANLLENILALALLAAILVLGSWPQPFIAYAGGL
jgi:NADH-quinone oxidoreductase subunit N